MIVSAIQVGPQRWSARLHTATGECVYNCPTYADEASALAGAAGEIERRKAAMVEAQQIALLEAARARALPLLIQMARYQPYVHTHSAPPLAFCELVEAARSLVDGIEFRQAAE